MTVLVAVSAITIIVNSQGATVYPCRFLVTSGMIGDGAIGIDVHLLFHSPTAIAAARVGLLQQIGAKYSLVQQCSQDKDPNIMHVDVDEDENATTKKKQKIGQQQA